MKTFKITLVALAVAATGVVSAATSDGTIGTDSTGTADVTLIKQDAVQITNVDTLDLGTHATLAADRTADDDVCVFNSTSSYNITFTSANGSFELQDGANSIPYSVAWSSNGGAVVPVAYSTAITGNTGDATSLTCGAAVTNANFAVTVTAADFNAANPGNYSDTLTLFVEAI